MFRAYGRFISDGIIESVGNIALQRFTKFCGTRVVEQIAEAVGDFFEEFRKVGATNLRFVKTGDNRTRTMTLWPDEETAEFAIEAIEAMAGSVQGVIFVAVEKGPLLAEFD